MPARAVLNVAYALLVQRCGDDTKARKQLDDDLYGWTEMNERANQALYGGGES